ncbi:MAG TPA: CoA transferase [Thermoplasmata archaeon]|nr:CoA transferase [Thermoplasmata archaeon]
MPVPPRPKETKGPPSPLAGVRVLDASRVLAGPYLAMLLGDLGADVIKIEKPDGGDPTRAWGPPFVGTGKERVAAYFLSANRNKRSVVLDLKSRTGIAAFERLASQSDILVENFLPWEWERLGVPGGEITKRFRRLVQCSVTGYGTKGDDSTKVAYDIVLQAETGLMGVTGHDEGEPIRVGVAVIDILTALYGLGATLAALRLRDLTKHGNRVEIAMVDAGTAFLSYAAQSWFASGEQPPRLGSRHPNLVPYQAFRAKDDWLVVGAGSEDMWRRFCDALGRPTLGRSVKFSTNEDRVLNREALERVLTKIFAQHKVDYWLDRFREYRVPAGRVASVEKVARAAIERGGVTTARIGIGTVQPLLLAPFVIGGRRPGLSRPPPRLGEHTVEVLREAGLSLEEVRETVIRSPATSKR